MTIPEFLDLLAKRAHETSWRFKRSEERRILRTQFDRCPIEFLTEGQAVFLADCITCLDLSSSAGRSIMYAADDDPRHDPALRRQLVQAVGVEEPTP